MITALIVLAVVLCVLLIATGAYADRERNRRIDAERELSRAMAEKRFLCEFIRSRGWHFSSAWKDGRGYTTETHEGGRWLN